MRGGLKKRLCVRVLSSTIKGREFAEGWGEGFDSLPLIWCPKPDTGKGGEDHQATLGILWVSKSTGER